MHHLVSLIQFNWILTRRDAKQSNVIEIKRKQKIISNNRRLVVYIHSYLVFRKRLKTLQSLCAAYFPSPLWSRLLVSEVKLQSAISPAGCLSRDKPDKTVHGFRFVLPKLTFKFDGKISNFLRISFCCSCRFPSYFVSWKSSSPGARCCCCCSQSRNQEVTEQKTTPLAVHSVTGSQLHLQSCCRFVAW